MGKKKPESKLGDKVKTAFEKEFPGIYLVKIHGGPYQESGIPDMVGCYQGRFIGIELKIEGNVPTEKQKDHLRRIEISGGIQGVAYSVAEAVQFVKKGVQFAISTVDKETNTCYNDNTLNKNYLLKGGRSTMAKKEKEEKKGKKKQEEALVEEEEDLELEDLDLEEDDDDEELEEDTEDEEEDEDDEDDEDDEEEEEPAPPKKSSKKSDKADKKAKAAPVKDEKKKRTSPTPEGVTPPMLQDIPEGALGTAEVAKMCGVEARRLRIVLRDKFYPGNGSKRYYWMPGSQELNEILDYFGKAPIKAEKKADKKAAKAEKSETKKAGKKAK
jgi:hypothetical protein